MERGKLCHKIRIGNFFSTELGEEREGLGFSGNVWECLGKSGRDGEKEGANQMACPFVMIGR